MRSNPFVLEQTELLREQHAALCDVSSELRASSRSLQAESRKAHDHARAIRAVSEGLARHKQRV